MTEQNSPPPLPPPLAYAQPYPQAPQRKPPLIAPWGIAPALLFIVVHCIFGWSQAKLKASSPDNAPAYLLGGIAGGLLISALLAWAAYAIGRRSTLAGTITFTVLLLLFTLSSIISSVLKPISAAKPLVQNIMADFRAKQAAARIPLSALQGFAGHELRDIDQPGMLEQRLSMLKNADAANHEVLDTGNAAATTLDQELKDEGFGDKRRKMIVGQFAQTFQWDHARKIYESNHRLFDDLMDFYQFLADHRDQWTYNEQSNRVDFANGQLLDQFKQYQSKIRDELKEQGKVTAKSGG
jgi:hypothetical protein